MIALILFVIFGLGFALFATQNTAPTTLNFGQYVLENVPLYLTVLATFGLGLLFATVFYIAKSITSGFLINKKRNEVEHLQRENTQLLKRIHQLELENTKLKAETGKESVDEDAL